MQPEGNVDPNNEDEQLARNLIANRDEPLYEGCRLTVFMAAFLFLTEKREGKIRDGAFDRLCRIIHEVLLPKGNLFPRSLYLMKKVVGCEDIDDYGLHVCVNECMTFPQIPKKDWKTHSHERCECGELRFEKKNRMWVPRKVIGYLRPLHTCIQECFANESYVHLRNRSRMGKNEFYSSTECDRLYTAASTTLSEKKSSFTSDRAFEVAQGEIRKTNPNCEVWDIGADFCQPFNTKAYSMGLVVVRNAALPDEVKSQKQHCKPLAITVGPSEPKNMDLVLKPIADQFEHGWKHGFEVTDGTNYFTYRVLLGGVFGDTPAQSKISRSMGHNAYLPCLHCECRGEYHDKAMRYPTTPKYGFFGENELKQRATNPLIDTGIPCTVGDPASKCSHQDIKEKAMEVENGNAAAQDMGFHGVCVFVKVLPYVDYNGMFVLPWAHAALLGVVKDFINLVVEGSPVATYKMSNENRNKIRVRAFDFTATCDIGRPYKCVVTKRGHYTMEDYLNFLEFWSLHIFSGGVLHEDMAYAWSLLRTSLLYFFRAAKVSGVCTNVTEAWQALFDYAEFMEEMVGLQMCKYNLHLLLCRLKDQESIRGAIHLCNEFWIELMIQFCKSSIRYRASKYPEITLFSDIIIDYFLSIARLSNPDVKTFDDWVPAYRKAARLHNVEGRYQKVGVRLNDMKMKAVMIHPTDLVKNPNRRGRKGKRYVAKKLDTFKFVEYATRSRAARFNFVERGEQDGEEEAEVGEDMD
jgi:hypothetical protein